MSADVGADVGAGVAVGTIVGLAETFTATFSPAHRLGNDTPAVLAVEVSLPVSFKDITAALWVAIRNGIFQNDMADDPDAVHAVVCYTLVHHNADVAAARREVADLPAGTPEWKTAIGLSMDVIRAYGNGDIPPANTSTGTGRAGAARLTLVHGPDAD